MILAVSCSPPDIGHLQNNTSEAVEYCYEFWGTHCQEIGPGKTAEVDFSSWCGTSPQDKSSSDFAYCFSIRTKGKTPFYRVEGGFPVKYAWHDANSDCPNCGRYSLQLKADLRVFILEPERKPSPIEGSPQPAGFPLEPSDSAA
jgi:hypothetical protein